MHPLLETMLLYSAPFVLFCIVWSVIVASLLRKSGLRALQQRYPLERPLGRDFQRLKVKSGRIGSVRFRGILRMQISDTCLVIRLMMPFALSFSGVQIPLSEIEDQGVHGNWIFKYRRLLIAGHICEFFGEMKPIVARLSQTHERIEGEESKPLE